MSQASKNPGADNKGHRTIHCKNFCMYLKELMCQGFLKEYILTSEAASGS